jgi:hypothetical protein
VSYDKIEDTAKASPGGASIIRVAESELSRSYS